ncbi:MAG: ATP-binding cassette domain-containing protein [Bacteroidales bacterium]|jgi:ABC-2 type transport system ATP-binding protein|nr:ATP-binding cassette domain-containing protein [Bacteroidales bacterium]
MDGNILVARDIEKQYGDVKVLDRVGMEVPQGSIYGLLGPNGAGKTTLIRIANRIIAPDSGELQFKGRRLQPSDIEQIGYLPEERGLYRKMKVGEQALYMARLKGMSRAAAMQQINYWFERFDVRSWWNRKVEELSKGMQQKLQFIISVLHQPALLILDEPFSGFDPINADMLKQEIFRLREEGATIILSTHNMASVEEMCDHISLIHQSRCILQGNVAQIRQQYKSGEFELGFEGDRTLLEDVLSAHGCEIRQSGQRGKVIIHAPEKTGNKLLSLAISCVKVTSFTELTPGMNDIFIRKVKENVQS